MTSGSSGARRRHVPMSRFIVPVLACAAGLGAAPVLAEDWIDTCEGYQTYLTIGGEESGPAQALKRVCEAIGPVVITQPCLVYYSRTTDTVFPPDAELAAKLKSECETSMPGGTSLPISSDAEDEDGEGDLAPADALSDALPPGDMLECGSGLECRPEPDDPSPVDADEVAQVTSGDGASSDGAPPPDADWDGVPPSVGAPPPDDMLECGAGLECRPEPDDPTPESPAANPGAVDPALDLAFWQAIVDSDDASLFEAYLARFPSGTFAPIAAARLAALTQPAAPSVTPPPQPATAALSPQAQFDAAQDIMGAAYQQDVAYWNAAAARAIPLYQAAADGGWAPAFVELGNLAENGIGMAPSLERARDYFLAAGHADYLEGYYRALMVLDQANDGPNYVETFLTLYNIDPALALDSLDAVGRAGPRALQSFLRDQGHYHGAIDGAFGPGSRAALADFVNGVPVDAAAPPPTQKPSDALAADLQQALARVGCYTDVVDGRWGPASAAALAAFNLWNASTLPTDAPSEHALRVVRATPGLICGVD